MTKSTPHGQVPEALIDLIDAYAETRHRCGGVYNAKTEAARNAVIEALSGVQALSAGTATPPAEKQATKETSGGFHVWRDISTAPKDGSRFVAIGYNYGLYSEGRHICVAQWFRGFWMETSDWNEASELKHLTHWLPLPSPPDNAAELNDLDVSVSPQQAPATQQAGDVVAYLDVGANGYLDLGSELSEDALQQLPKGRHALVIAGTYGIDGYVAAPQPSPTTKPAPQPSPAAQGDAIEHELAMLIRRFVSSARRNCEDESNVLKLANEAWTYLVRKGLNGSPMRDAGIESDPTPPAKAADSVAAPAPLSESIDQLERKLAIIGVVGAIDGHDVVRRESVLEIARRAALAAQGGK